MIGSYVVVRKTQHVLWVLWLETTSMVLDLWSEVNYLNNLSLQTPIFISILLQWIYCISILFNFNHFLFSDFKFFLTGELTEDAPEEPEVEQDAEAEPQDGDENEAEGENENADKTEGEDAKEVVEEVEEEVKPKTQEEIEAEERRERMKKKSILWAFASQPLPEKKEEPIAPVETPQPSDEAVDDKSAENEKKNDNENQSETSDLKPVTSVTVNYLDSIKEEGDTTDAVTSEQNDNDGSKSELPNASTRRQSFSAMTSVDSGIDGTDADEIQKHSVEQSESITDDGFISRTHSAKSRLTYDRSRASSARSNFTSRPSTAGSRYDDDIEESVQDEEESQAFSGRSERRSSKSTAGDIEKDEDSEESVIIEDDEFKSPLSSRQIEFLENSKEQQIYCEAGVVRNPDNDISDDDTLDLESIIQYDPYTISPRVNLTRLKKEKTKSVPVLERSRSATRLRTFKKIENAILIRQNTDPRLNIAHIKAANERTMRERNQKRVQRKLNSNGLCCTHINIDLNVEDEAKPKVSAQQTSLKMLLKRPQTAMTFREAEKLNIVYGKNYETISNKYSSSRDIKIVDLSNMVSMDTDRYETPGLVNHHHGYKSVLPLGRVLSGHKSKINNGNGIVLNSMSRKLERIANLTQIANDKQTRSQHNLTHHHHHKISNLSNRQSIINLEMPDLISKQKQTCRTYSPRYFSRSLIRT